MKGSLELDAAAAVALAADWACRCEEGRLQAQHALAPFDDQHWQCLLRSCLACAVLCDASCSFLLHKVCFNSGTTFSGKLHSETQGDKRERQNRFLNWEGVLGTHDELVSCYKVGVLRQQGSMTSQLLPRWCLGP